MANKIGCSTGKVTVIDPNDFNGYNSQSNMSVPLEELNISVVLKTFRKGRTVLSKTAEGGSRESSQTVSINFIEGTNIDGSKKVLTTKYTDLTTVFETGTINSETLGITNIDIDFNPSMAPMITINFIDVRGSSIFQNEQNISGNNSGNKYSTFFQLPYPLFELEVKGYYGKPVTYCLHMLKFNAKFNSQTGNFEIQCQFVGYTYAMLSDLLIGYLKAIPYTEIGARKYEEYNNSRKEKEKEPIIDLNQLMKKISEINEEIPKLSADSEAAKSINTTDKALESLDKIKGVINTFGAALDIDDTKEKTEYTFVLAGKTKPKTEVDAAITDYNDSVKANIEEFNTLATGTASLDENYFKDIITTGKDKGFYQNIKKSDLATTSTTIDSILTTQTGSDNNKTKFKEELLNFVNRYYGGQGEDFVFDVYNMTAIIDKINKTKADMVVAQDLSKKTLANELKTTFRETLGFEPVIRNIVEIFTVAIEIMMETIYEVSTVAEDPKNTSRNDELEKKFSTNLVKVSDIKETKLNTDTNKYFAWPDYKERDETTKTYVNKYLGAPGVLEAPYKVTELEFIDDLLNAFIKAQKDANEVAESDDGVEKTWYPINVFDTKLFVDKEPYERVEMKTKSDVVRMMVQRGMTFLGYTNNPSMFDSENKEIMAMAEIEVDAILRVVKNPELIQSLTQLTPKFISEIGISTGPSNFDPLLKVVNNKYYYNYPNTINGTDTNTQVIIPLNQDFSGYWDMLNPSNRKEKENEGAVFLSNYSSEYRTNWGEKVDDGAVYIKILKPSEYNVSNLALEQAPAGLKTENVFNYNKMSAKVVDYSAGYNSFGGPLGIQEYENMDFGKSSLQGLKLMYSFYMDSDIGLAYNRKDSGELQGTSKKAATDSVYDYNPNGKVKVIDGDKTDAYNSKTEDFKIHFGLGQNRALLAKYTTGQKTDLTYPYVEQKFFIYDEVGDSDTGYLRQPYADYSFSLFGSKWYYLQDEAKCVFANGGTKSCEMYSKALMFLHTLPFNVNMNDEGETLGTLDPTGGNNQHADPFKPYEEKPSGWEILHTFNEKGGFIHVPRLWAAQIGGILWMMSSKDPVMDGDKIVGGGSGTKHPVIWKKSCGGEKFNTPAKWEYFPPILDIEGDTQLVSYPNLLDSDIIRRLPEQVKDEFKKVFFEFVNGDAEGLTSFDDIRGKLEIWDGSSQSFCTFVASLHTAYDNSQNDDFNGSLIKNEPKFKNAENYQIITILDVYNVGEYTSNMHKDYLFLELKDEPSQTLIKAMTEELIIANGTYKIWQNDVDNVSFLYDGVGVPKDKFELYFATMIATLKAKGDAYSPNEIKKDIEQQLFGTTDESTIKLILYNTCKNLHDKWLAGVTDPNNVIFQCGDSSGKPFRNKSDDEVASKYGNPKARLIDSFRFISRSFKDIGDKLYINPIPVNDYLVESPNTSAYNAISGLLDSNKFTFDALPTFINFRDPANVEAIFEPMPNYEDAIQNGSCGPSFVCVYAGQTSKHLDFANSYYENDGFDFGCDSNNNVLTSVPKDFTEDIGGGEDPIAVFKVVYGQQNQNIFKDISLDQSEFTETDESLQIQDQISNQQSETNRSLAGQNIYNVYAVRSYSAEIEMLGNAMIQPMMYFQLDNIPMFHGAYMVTRVKHNIKPNFMSTNFTGVRIRHAETPLVTAMDLYMSMVGEMDTSAAGTGTIISGKFQPIVATLIENGVTNGYMELGKPIGSITNKKVDLSGTKFINVAGATGFMITEAADAFKKMLTELTTWVDGKVAAGVLKGKKNGDKIIYGQASSFYRPYSVQKNIEGNRNTAKAGTSYHGWGIAVDWTWVDKNGKLFQRNYGGKGGSPASDFDFKKDPILEWLYNNSYRFGFINPKWARDGGSYDEVWHWEYHGKTAKCLMEGSEYIFKQKIDLTKGYDSVVKNPKTLDGKEAVYTGCDYKTIEKGDGLETPLKTEAGCPSIQKPMKVQTSYKSNINKLLNGTYKCGANRDCVASIEGFKQVNGFFTNGALNKKGIIALTQALLEGFGSSPQRRNPGNLRDGKRFAVYGTWKEGWTRYLNDKLIRWSDGNPVVTESASYVKCYDTDSNEVFKKTGVNYKENIEYNYKQGQSPTLRQYTNIYAPWGDNNNPTNYCAAIAITLKDYGYNINVDDKMDTWI